MSAFGVEWGSWPGQFMELQIQLLLIWYSDSCEHSKFMPGFPHQHASGIFPQAIYLDLSQWIKMSH